ncbi:hypothetical protein H2248_001683 [Termitomyces sp. 'cryptogamus']|nr:hypothetical protein H2248_001683 [Termitomyces sp. 'cryptogamus']
MSSSAARCLLSISVPANKHLPPQAPAAADTDATGGTFEFLPALDLPYYNSLFVSPPLPPSGQVMLSQPSLSRSPSYKHAHLIEYQTRTRRTPEKPTPAYTCTTKIPLLWRYRAVPFPTQQQSLVHSTTTPSSYPVPTSAADVSPHSRSKTRSLSSFMRRHRRQNCSCSLE